MNKNDGVEALGYLIGVILFGVGILLSRLWFWAAVIAIILLVKI